MAVAYSAAETAGLGDTPVSKIVNQHLDVIAFPATITYASQADGTTIPLCKVPAGYRFLYGVIAAGASSGSTTIAVGTSGSSAKYKAAAAFTSTDTPTFFGKAAAMAKLTAGEEIIATLAAAQAPSSGTLVITMFFAAP